LEGLVRNQKGFDARKKPGGFHSVFNDFLLATQRLGIRSISVYKLYLKCPLRSPLSLGLTISTISLPLAPDRTNRPPLSLVPSGPVKNSLVASQTSRMRSLTDN
jgi:hypothetical protein